MKPGVGWGNPKFTVGWVEEWVPGTLSVAAGAWSG